jgi:hypothetical protein
MGRPQFLIAKFLDFEHSVYISHRRIRSDQTHCERNFLSENRVVQVLSFSLYLRTVVMSETNHDKRLGSSSGLYQSRLLSRS